MPRTDSWRVERGKEFVSEKMAKIAHISLISNINVLIFRIDMNIMNIY